MATKGPLWVGLDVGADTMALCCTNDEGEVLFGQALPTSAHALHALLKPKRRRIGLIALEAGAFGVALTRALRELGYTVAVFDTFQASKFLSIRRNKTDQNDARGLADLARLGRHSVAEVTVKTSDCQRLRSTLVTRQRLVRLRVGAEATMRSLIRLNGGRLKGARSAAAFRKNALEELRRLKEVERIDLSEEVAPLLELATALRTYVEKLDHKLDQTALDDPVCRRFLDIPGVGSICALSFYSAIGDPTRFRRNADVGAYLGLTPRVRQSGQSTLRLHISKTGDTMTRANLTIAAGLHLRYANSALAVWGKALAERSGRKRARTAVARKLAVIMTAMWKAGVGYDATGGAHAAKLIYDGRTVDCSSS